MALTQVTSGLISSVSNTAISGLITSAQIASVANTQVTGLMTASQIATVANTQITGVMTASQIATVANTQVTGLITSAQIATVANTQVTGLITSGQIASVANTQITGILGTSNGGTNSTATPTSGGVGYGTGTALVYTSAGSSGQVLTSNGTSAPSWSTPSSGAMTLISTINAAVTSVVFTGLSGYNNYILVFNGLAAANPGYQLEMQIGTGSTTYLSSSYYNISKSGYGDPGTNAVTNNDSYYVNRDRFYITQDQTDTTTGASGYINLFNFTNGKNMSYNTNMQYQAGSGSNFLGYAYGWGYIHTNTTTKTAIQIFPESGGFSGGTVTLYGISS